MAVIHGAVLKPGSAAARTQPPCGSEQIVVIYPAKMRDSLWLGEDSTISARLDKPQLYDVQVGFFCFFCYPPPPKGNTGNNVIVIFGKLNRFLFLLIKIKSCLKERI